jgi:hypothetical protein
MSRRLTLTLAGLVLAAPLLGAAAESQPTGTIVVTMAGFRGLGNAGEPAQRVGGARRLEGSGTPAHPLRSLGGVMPYFSMR